MEENDVPGCELHIEQIRALAHGIGAIAEKLDIAYEQVGSIAQLALLIEKDAGKIAVKLGFEE